MSTVIQVLIGLLTTFIGFLLGAAWQISRRRIMYWRARRFWRPFVSGDTIIVVGRFREFDTFESSGLVGAGDMQAAAELKSFFADIGFRRQERAVDIVYHDQLLGDSYGSNLICIGGSDANRVTQALLERVDHKITLGESKRYEIFMRDTETKRTYYPELRPGPGGLQLVTLDYGLLIKAPNPFDLSREVIIIAGSFGYGTWAGAKLARSPEFLRASLTSKRSALECLFKVQVAQDVPQQPEIVVLRKSL